METGAERMAREAKAACERAIRESEPAFERFFLARWLGLSFTYEGETCTVGFEAAEFMFNPQGSLHGGIMATVMDIAMGHLLHHVLGAGSTLEMKVQYLRAAGRGPLACRAEFIQRGRSISFLRASLRDGSGGAIAFASATWKLRRPTESDAAHSQERSSLKETQ